MGTFGIFSLLFSVSLFNSLFQGRIIQTKKLKDDLSQPIEAEWKSCFNHTIDGTIVNVSESPNDGLIQFAVLYRRLEKDDLLHYVRVYYFPDQDDDMQYKDLFIPGTTLVKEISLEDDCILLHRYVYLILKICVFSFVCVVIQIIIDFASFLFLRI